MGGICHRVRRAEAAIFPVMTSHSTDIAIIGAGPVGLFAVFEAGMLGLSCHVLDALDQPGGQCTALYPEKPIYDIPGHPRIDAGVLVDRLVEQAAPFKPIYHMGGRVERLRQQDGRWHLETDKAVRIEAGALIVAAGGGAFGPNRPPLAGIERYEGHGVSYLVRRREDYRGKRVVIAGGGDSAVDWANSLAEVAARLYMVHRRPKFRAAPESVKRMEALVAAGRIELVVPYQLDSLEGDGTKLTGVGVATLDGDKRMIAADALLPFFGLSMELGPIAEWGLELDQKHIRVDPATCATSARGIYAIGDIIAYAGKLKLILSGFAEAAAAAHAIRTYLRPDTPLHFEYSTTKGVPGT
jgi:thioredoxin reductase (NADPH)